MEDNTLVTVYTVTDANEAEVIRLGLEGEGIRCEIGNETQGGLAGLGIMKIDLLVLAKDKQAAEAYLKEHHHAPDDE